MRTIPTVAVFALSCLGLVPAQAADREPVSKVISGYSLQEYDTLAGQLSEKTALVGGDVSLFATTRLSEFFHTAIVPPRLSQPALPSAPNPAIGKIEAETDYGMLSLDDFLVHPKSFAQGFIVVHHGKVVYESYPGMKPGDNHMWASTAKPLGGLLMEQLIDEGVIDEDKTYGHYVPDFRGTVWEDIRIIDIMNMASGLNVLEDDKTRSDPTSITTRLFRSEFGEPDPVTNKLESTRDVLKAAIKLIDPGKSFDYSSALAQSLVILIEEVTQKRFSDLLDERVFSHVALEGDLQVHLSSSDGLAVGHGLVSSRLRDLALFGMLYTPSWSKIATKQVVSDAALKRIQKDTPSHEVFMAGSDGPRFSAALADEVISNNRQWDDVFADGDFFKLGFLGQGIYVSPSRDLVIAYFSTNPDTGPGQRYMRPLAKSGLFDK